MFEEERDELLKHIEAEDDAEVRVCMEEDLQQVARVLEIVEKLVERIGYWKDRDSRFGSLSSIADSSWN